MSQELKKVSMNLSVKTLNNINELSRLLDESNRTRVVASALEIAKYIIEKASEGSLIVIKEINGNTKELKFIPK